MAQKLVVCYKQKYERDKSDDLLAKLEVIDIQLHAGAQNTSLCRELTIAAVEVFDT